MKLNFSFAHIDFSDASEATSAMNSMNGADIEGRRIRIDFAASKLSGGSGNSRRFSRNDSGSDRFNSGDNRSSSSARGFDGNGSNDYQSSSHSASGWVTGSNAQPLKTETANDTGSGAGWGNDPSPNTGSSGWGNEPSASSGWGEPVTADVMSRGDGGVNWGDAVNVENVENTAIVDKKNPLDPRLKKRKMDLAEDPSGLNEKSSEPTSDEFMNDSYEFQPAEFFSCQRDSILITSNQLTSFRCTSKRTRLSSTFDFSAVKVKPRK